MIKKCSFFVFFRLNAAIEATHRRLESDHHDDRDDASRERPPAHIWSSLVCPLPLEHAFTAFSVFMTIRFVATSLALHHPDSQLAATYFAYGHLNGYINSDGAFDATILLSDIGAFLGLAYFHDAVHRRPNCLFWTIAYDLLTGCRLTRVDLAAQQHESLVDLCRQMLTRWRSCQSQSPAQLAFLFSGNHRGLPVMGHFPHLLLPARAQLSCLLLAVNLAHGLLFLSCFVVGVAILVTFLLMVYLSESASGYFLFEALSMPCLLYFFLFGFECALFFVYFYPLLAFIYWASSRRMLNRLTRRLSMPRSKSGGGKKRKVLSTEEAANSQLGFSCQQWQQLCLTDEWSRLQAHHVSLARIVIVVSREVTSPGFCVTFLATISMNICGLTMLLVRWRSLTSFSVLLYVTVLALQSAAYAFCFACCISITDSLHCTELMQALVLLVQMRLTGRRCARAKFKLAALYERLQCPEKAKIAFDVGPLSKMSWRAVFEFSFIYTGFIFFFASILLDAS